MILFIISAGFLAFFYGWQMSCIIIEDIVPQIKRFNGITFKSLAYIMAIGMTIALIVIAIYFMVMYCEGNLYFAQSFGIDDEIKHLPDVSMC